MVFTPVQRLFQPFKYSKESISNIVKRFVAGDANLNVAAPTLPRHNCAGSVTDIIVHY